MKTIRLLFIGVLLFFCKHSSGQIVICDTMPLAYINSGIYMGQGLLPADSMIFVPIVNTSVTNFAYPLAKIIPQTSMPAGMSFYNSGWQVFASSWNTGDTMACGFEFIVAQSIPPNYSVTFTLYVSNFLPLSIDSCVFANTFTINLNPTAGIIQPGLPSQDFIVLNNPANEKLLIETYTPKTLEIRSMDGKFVKRVDITTGATSIDISELAAGTYLLCDLKTAKVKKIIVMAR